MAMKLSVGKLVPSAIVVAVAGSCTWTVLSGADRGGDGPKGKLPEVTAAMLSPAIGTASGRDPFKGPGEAQPNVLAKLRYKETTTSPKAAAEAGDKGEAAIKAPAKVERANLVENGRTARVVSSPGDAPTRPRPDSPAPIASKPAPVPKVDLALLLTRLDLKATWVQGPRRAAVINGRIYRPGEALEGTTTALVADVLPGRVLLECEGGRAELTLPEIMGKPGARAPVPTGPRPAQAPARRGGGAGTKRKAR